MLTKILSDYGIGAAAVIQPFGSGLINSTWKVRYVSADFILQKVNHKIFKQPGVIAYNIETMGNYLAANNPGYYFVRPVKTIEGKTIVYVEGEGYFRMFPFVENSHTVNVTETPAQAYEAARQFGLFTRVLKSFPAENLRTTLPDFHNLAMRYDHFNKSLLDGDPLRIKQAGTEIRFLQLHDYIVATYKTIAGSPEFKLRVTHHDTKISNVLFDERGKGICVIDLDTVMGGYFISDIGDMMRTYLSPVSEEEKDLDKITIRDAYFEAIVKGYLQEMSGELTDEEIKHFVYSGIFMIYMQAVRFLADHLNNDVYYGASYEGHNYMRAKNQIQLLKMLFDKEESFTNMVNNISKTMCKPEDVVK